MEHFPLISRDKNKSLWIFPQGIIKPPNFRPIEFQTGLTYIAQKVVEKAGGVNLIPMCVHYTFLREDKPEVLVEVKEPYIIKDINEIKDRKWFTHKLASDFEVALNEQVAQIQAGHLNGYDFLFKQKLPWYKKLEKRLKRI